MRPRDEKHHATDSSPSSSELQATAAMCQHCFDVLVEELKCHPHISNNKHQSSSTTATSNTGSRLWFPFATPAASSRSSSSSSSKNNNNTPSSSTLSSTPAFVHQLPNTTIECPLFVTWDKTKPQSKRFPVNLLGGGDHTSHKDQPVFELRGCIGTLSPKPLRTSLGEYALTSALRDRRFHPVAAHEVPYLRVAVSLLVKYEPCEDCFDWTVGVHGILIRFVHHRREYSATYLPEVAHEQQWDQKTAVTALMRKAGFAAKITPDLFREVSCTRYQSSKHRMTFGEYEQWKLQQQQSTTITQQQQSKRQKSQHSFGTQPSTEPSSASSSFGPGSNQDTNSDDHTRISPPIMDTNIGVGGNNQNDKCCVL